MCYNKCKFEDHEGECFCRIFSKREDIKKKYGHSPCTVGGGGLEMPEDYEEFEKLKLGELVPIILNDKDFK